MQPNLFPFGSVLGNPFLFNGDLSEGGFESSRVFFLLPFLLSQGGAMDLSKVGEKILSSVKSARSLGLLPSPSDRPEVPARAAAAAAVARALAGLPPHQRYSLSSSSTELSSIYGTRPSGEVVPEPEDDFYEEEFDPVRYILEHAPSEETELAYFEKQAALRLSQLDLVSERLSRNVMEHHEVMVKGMNLVRELERDLKVANVICMNGRRHLNSSMNEVSRDLIVNSNSKKKQALSDVLPVLAELLHAMDMQNALESLVEEGDYCKAFQVLSEYLQLLDGFSELSAMKEMSKGVEVWLGKTLQKLDSLLLGVCQEFKEQNYLTVVDAYALIGDISGLAEKIQSFYMQEVLSETQTVLRSVVLEDQEMNQQNSRLTFSDLCHRIQESKFRQCLLQTLAVLFKLMCSYYEIMSFQLENEGSAALRSPSFKQRESESDGRVSDSQGGHAVNSESFERLQSSKPSEESADSTSHFVSSGDSVDMARDNGSAASASGSPWYQLRKDATSFVSQTLQRGRKNLWQLTTSRVSVLLSSAVISSTSIHQFLRIYEDLNVFVLAGEAFCGVEATEFRNKLKAVCENYFAAFHRQNVYALKMVLEKENWLRLPPETAHVITFAGLVGDGAALIVPSGITARELHSDKSSNSADAGSRKGGFSHWLRSGNIFLQKLGGNSKDCQSPNGGITRGVDGVIADHLHDYRDSPRSTDANRMNGYAASEEENEDLLADFIDEDSQLPSRISKPNLPKRNPHFSDEDSMVQTGSSLSLLRSMDKYARLMQKLEIVNVEFFKGMCQLFEIFFYFIYETFGPPSNSTGKGLSDFHNYRLKSAMSRITQDCDQWLKPLNATAPSSSTASLNDVTPTSPSTTFGQLSGTSLGLKERCTGADTVSLVARILHKSKAHLQSMLLRNNAVIVDDFFANLVDTVPDLIEHIHRTTARQLLHISGYADRIASAKWEVKELGLEHNGYVDLMLGEFKHYKTRLMHGGIHKEVQDILLEHGLEIVAETLTEGLSRVKRCTDEGRALMSLDLQVLINGLQHFVSANVRPKFQIVEAFIKAYYLPETEYVHWARGHPEYTKNQIVGLINLVATMKGWKRKTRLEVLEKIE
ncbi:syndetin [Punica granatum]|uniref:Syndetin n=3 Tax=Punica granatum TaxID=22663 RepID=A0A6P8CUF5_PUNGR|nr:syndetin [Punica granatum]